MAEFQVVIVWMKLAALITCQSHSKPPRLKDSFISMKALFMGRCMYCCIEQEQAKEKNKLTPQGFCLILPEHWCYWLKHSLTLNLLKLTRLNVTDKFSVATASKDQLMGLWGIKRISWPWSSWRDVFFPHLFRALNKRTLPKAMNQLKHKQTIMETRHKRVSVGHL